MSVSCGSVSFGPPLRYLPDEDEIFHQYRSLPHKTQMRGYGPPNNITYPNYSSTVSTPRNRPQSTDRTSLIEALNNSDKSEPPTVIDQVRHNSIQLDPEAAGYLVVQGVEGPVVHEVPTVNEDNLSHDSYELIEKAIEIEVPSTTNSNVNQFEQEFFRQAAQASKNGSLSLSSSPKRAPAPSEIQEASPVTSIDMARVKSQDSFSQASNHAGSDIDARNTTTIIDVTHPEIHVKEEPRLMVDIVRTNAGNFVIGENRSSYSHSLPRSNADIIYNIQQKDQFSRTLPNRSRRSPVYYSRSRIAPPPGECSSGSSSSHASPQISRPKSLEFSVVNVNNLPNKQAYGYHDDSLDLVHYPQPKPRTSLAAKPIDPYDDSSSAINEQLSSSDVPQTPENSNITFLPLEAGPVIVGCHQGIVRKQYYTTEERIYDVPEGIEGVSAPIKVITSQPPQVVTSPSSSSGITDPYVPPTIQEVVIPQVVVPQPGPPVPPPHKPVIAQHVSSRHIMKLPKVDIDPRKFQVLMQDSTESADSTSVGGILRNRPIRPVKGRGTAQSHYSTTTLPPPQRALLATMSSTESESAMSARSAPTPISNPDQLMNKRGNNILVEILPEQPESPKLQVNLISPPAEESESSTAVLDSEGVPAPPPEFSGAAVVSDDDPQQATDVEEDSQSCQVENKVEEEVEKDEPIQESDSNTTATVKIEETDIKEIEIESEEKVDPIEEQEETEDDEASSKVIKIADLYVKLEHNGSGSTISDEGNTGSDMEAPVPFIDEEKEDDLINNLDGAAAEMVTLPTQQHAESIFIPPTPTNLSKIEEPPKVEEEEDISIQPSIEEDIAKDPIEDDDDIIAKDTIEDDIILKDTTIEDDIIPVPPPVLQDEELKNQPSVESTSSTSSPPPPPPMLLDGSEGPPTALYTAEASSFPFPPRTLSRHSGKLSL